MTNDIIREKAEALIKDVESGGIINVRAMKSYIELKAALRPSREEIANYLERELLLCSAEQRGDTCYKEDARMLDYAIEELRKDE